MNLINRFLGRLCFDRLVRAGRMPSSGWRATLMRRAGKSRIVSLPPDHPLQCILSRKEWFTSYSISHQTLIWLWAFLSENRPTGVLEMGSGASTLTIALLARHFEQTAKPFPIVSIDHDERWLGATAERLKALDLTNYVQLLHCPLQAPPTELACGAVQTYAVDIDELRTRFDSLSPNLVLIDGPPGRDGRGATLPGIISLLPDHANIFLDDSNREREQAAVADWVRLFPERVSNRGILPLGTGLAWLQTA